MIILGFGGKQIIRIKVFCVWKACDCDLESGARKTALLFPMFPAFPELRHVPCDGAERESKHIFFSH